MKCKFLNFYKTTIILKNRLLLLSLLVMPVAAFSQVVEPDPKSKPEVKFYSKGKMYVGATAVQNAGATMYIDGSAKFANYSNAENEHVEQAKVNKETGTAQITQIGVTKLTGDFVDAFTTQVLGEADTLFTKESFNNGMPLGTIWFAGEDNVQRIYRAEGVNHAAFGYNYINFPTLRVDKKIEAGGNLEKIGYVSVDTSAVITVGNLEIGDQYTGGFAVEASYLSGTQVNKIRSAYALVKDINNGNPQTSDGWCRVNYSLWNPADTTTNTFPKEDITNFGQFSGGTAGSNVLGAPRYLTAFSSPFETLPLDYALWQVVLKPNDTALDSGEGPIPDPDYKMKAGEAYLLAQNVSDAGYNNFTDWTTGKKPEHKFEGGYIFSRQLLHNYFDKTEGKGYKFSRFNVNQLAEYFNTKDVEVTLKRGFNFVGNPYLIPLSLSSLVNRTNSEVGNDFRYPANMPETIVGEERLDHAIYRANFAYYADDAEKKGIYATRKIIRPIIDEVTGERLLNEVAARYHVIKDGYIYEIDLTGTWWGVRYRFGVGYYVSQYEGSTSYTEGSDVDLIAPMGVFCLERPISKNYPGDEEVKIKIRRPSELSVLTKKPIALAPKSAAVGTYQPNELLIQTLDNTATMEDRHCLVFRDNMSMDDKVGTPVVKDISTVGNESYQLPVGTVYTKSLTLDDKGKRTPMHINFVPKDIKQMALYVVPPSFGSARNITLKGYRMETLEKVKSVWVEDRLDGSIRELTKEGLDYTLPVSMPNPGEELDYRFILHFSETYDLGITDPVNPIDPTDPNSDGDLKAYYVNSDSKLNIVNLIATDTNSKVDVYDLQGRLISRFRISGDDASRGMAERSLSLAQGTYIVRIVGNRNYTSKFLSLQN